MSASPYRAVSWEPSDLITRENLGQMSNNDQFILDNTPRAWYTAYGHNQTEGLRIVAGTILFTPSAEPVQTKRVHFGSQFTDGSRPVITQSTYTRNNRVHHSITGLSGLIPDDTGFEITLRMDYPDPADNKFNANMYVAYIALGY